MLGLVANVMCLEDKILTDQYRIKPVVLECSCVAHYEMILLV